MVLGRSSSGECTCAEDAVTGVVCDANGKLEGSVEQRILEEIIARDVTNSGDFRYVKVDKALRLEGSGAEPAGATLGAELQGERGGLEDGGVGGLGGDCYGEVGRVVPAHDVARLDGERRGATLGGDGATGTPVNVEKTV